MNDIQVCSFDLSSAKRRKTADKILKALSANSIPFKVVGVGYTTRAVIVSPAFWVDANRLINEACGGPTGRAAL